MATYLENLTTAREALAAKLALVAGTRNYNIDGQQVDTGELFKRIEILDNAIAAAQGTFEIVDQAIT